MCDIRATWWIQGCDAPDSYTVACDEHREMMEGLYPGGATTPYHNEVGEPCCFLGNRQAREPLTNEEQAKLKYVRLMQTYNTLQAAHLQVIGSLGSVTGTLNAITAACGGVPAQEVAERLAALQFEATRARFIVATMRGFTLSYRNVDTTIPAVSRAVINDLREAMRQYDEFAAPTGEAGEGGGDGTSG